MLIFPTLPHLAMFCGASLLPTVPAANKKYFLKVDSENIRDFFLHALIGLEWSSFLNYYFLKQLLGAPIYYLFRTFSPVSCSTLPF